MDEIKKLEREEMELFNQVKLNDSIKSLKIKRGIEIGD